MAAFIEIDASHVVVNEKGFVQYRDSFPTYEETLRELAASFALPHDILGRSPGGESNDIDEPIILTPR